MHRQGDLSRDLWEVRMQDLNEQSTSTESTVVGPDDAQALKEEQQEGPTERDEALKKYEEALTERDEALKKEQEALTKRNEALREREEALTKRDGALREREEALEKGRRDLRITARLIRSEGFRNGLRVKRIAITALVLSFLALLTLGYYRYLPNFRDANLPVLTSADGPYVLLSALFGSVIGASELISRYRDAPVRALLNSAAGAYLLVNAIVSACTYGLLTNYGRTFIPALTADPLMRSIVAGFGAMAVLRSKFFTLRTEKGEDISVGPDAAISVFLSAADRGVDRTRAAKRLQVVYTRPNEILRYDGVKEFIKTSLDAFQNISKEERARIEAAINRIYGPEGKKEYSNEKLKLQALCYEILIIVGEHDFDQLMDNLRDYLVPPEQILPPVSQIHPPRLWRILTGQRQPRLEE
jgi:hypothetical protein